MISQDLINKCCELFCVHQRDLLGDYRFRFVARARQALYLALRRRGWSYHRIGQLLNRDHSTVMYGVQIALEIERRDPEYARKVALITDLDYDI